MKKNFITGMAVGAVLLGITGIASATTINYLSTDSAANKTSAYTYLDNFKIETFNYAGLGSPEVVANLDQQTWTWEGSGQVVTGSQSGRYAAPFGLSEADQTKYLSVPNPISNGSITANLVSKYNYLGLWWGSVDTYNSISFFNGNTLVESFTGSQVISPSVANGNQSAQSTNIYVNFLNVGEFDSFRLTSTQYALEVDNIAVGTAPVPEPATMLLFGTGLAGLAGVIRRKKKA